MPGKLPFANRPPLAIRIFSRLAVPGENDRQAQISRVRRFHISLLVLILICTYAQGQLLGLGNFGALIAPTILAIFPWFGFYVHSYFADIIRTAIVSAALTMILAHIVTRRLSYLVMGGLVGGFAILARVSIYQFMLVAIGIIVVGTWWDQRAKPTRVRIIRSVSPALLLAGLLLLIVTPQLIRNSNDGHGWRIAANTWRQIEYGLKRPPPSASPEEKEAYTYKDASRAYFKAGRPFPVREKYAKEITLEYIESIPLATLVARRQKSGLNSFSIYRHISKSVSASSAGGMTLSGSKLSSDWRG